MDKGYLLTSESNPGDDRPGISLAQVQKWLSSSPIKNQIVWLDCCHSGGLLLDVAAANPERRDGYSRCFIASSRDFEPSWTDLNTPYSTLTKALLAGLDPTRQPGQGVTTYSLVDYVTQALQHEPQTPLCDHFGQPLVLLPGLASPGTEQDRFRRQWAIPLQMPPLPEAYVERPEHETPVKASLLAGAPGGSGTLVVSALYGLGGIGKSVLAIRLAHDPAVQGHFADGILWVTLGQTPDLLPLLNGWIVALGDRDYQPTTEAAASSHLRTLLYDKTMLLVVDDVWQVEHLDWFRVGGQHCRVLVTTREARIPDARIYELDPMTPDQALTLITQTLARPLELFYIAQGSGQGL
ncbi:MAG: NB-ARC domain-containing protein, partial [Nodosilinea sp.]